MVATLRGPVSKTLTRNADGHREYRVKFNVMVSSPNDGPAVVAACPGLPTVGTPYVLGNDIDLWATLRPEMEIKHILDKEKNRFWTVELLYSTRPLTKCSEQNFENPLLEPMKVSGTFVNNSEEATFDRFGLPIKNSSHEQIRGPQVEFDSGSQVVVIEQNVASLQLGLLSSLFNTVNNAPLWGMAYRTVRFFQCRWEKKWYGTCNYYYTRSLGFEIKYETHDRDILDEGSKVLNGRWGRPAEGEPDRWITIPVKQDGSSPDPDYLDPTHFIRAKDRNGENIRVVLNGYGQPLSGLDIPGTGSFIDEPGNIRVEKYPEANLLLLGIPTIL